MMIPVPKGPPPFTWEELMELVTVLHRMERSGMFSDEHSTVLRQSRQGLKELADIRAKANQ